MLFSKEIDLVDPTALSSVPLAERGWDAAVPYNQASRLLSAALAKSLKQMGFCIMEGFVAEHRPPPMSALFSSLK